jgi:glucosamine kinase
MASRLLVDVGQTGTRLRIEPGSGGPIDDQADGVRTEITPESYLATVVDEMLRRHAARVDAVAAGLSGLQGAPGDAQSLLRHWAGFGVRLVALADDAVTGYLGAIGSTPGVVLSVGTGVVALAAADNGAVARVNGWGYLLGDEGGGYWIGRAGLQAALHAFDGRGPQTLLLETAIVKLGPAPVIGVALQRDPDRVRTVAAFARDVLELANRGDAAASEICEAAGAELARAAHAAARRAGCRGEQIRVSWSGSLLTASAVLREALQRELATFDPRYLLVPPSGSQLDGARMLVDLPDTHPIAALIVRAAKTTR